MPHSSGGGSSYEGSHSFSDDNDNSFSSGGSSSDNDYNSKKRVTVTTVYSDDTPQVWARYNEDNKYDYYYTNGPLRKSYLSIFRLVLFYAVIGLLFWAYDPVLVIKPVKLSWEDVQSTNVLIDDQTGIFDDTTRLSQALIEFRNTTGIIPVVVTINNDLWQGKYENLSKYAYNWYVYNFSDEKHWLIMYSEYNSRDANDKFSNWYWEGMQGDDTDEIITHRIADEFTSRLHENFIASNRFTRADAIADAFEYLNNQNLMRPRWQQGLMRLIVWGMIDLVHCLFVLNNRRRYNKRYKGYKRIYRAQIENNRPLEDTCEYCNCCYIVGTISVCPHCGAAIPAHSIFDKA